MISYILRRIFYAIPILISVNILTFLLFFYVNTPDDIAYLQKGAKNAKPEEICKFKREMNYHQPLLLNRRDTVYCFTSDDKIRESISLGFKDYTLVKYDLTEDHIKQAVATINPDSIILIDEANMSADTASMLVAKLLPKAVPFIVLKYSDYTIPAKLTDPTIVVHLISSTDTQKDLAEIRRYVDQQQATGFDMIRRTIFFDKSVRLFWFDFGKADSNNQEIGDEVVARMGPSLCITVPSFILGLFINIFVAMIVAYCRGTYVDRSIMLVCIINISILSLFYYFMTQLVFGVWLRICPVSGFLPGLSAIRFIMLPVFASLLIGFGGGVRFYRTIFLEEINRDYVKTARAKGLSEFFVLYKHVLKNAMIPILTGVVVILPMLFTGSLILESYFGIPGLGGYTLEGLEAQDFRIVGSMVYLGSVLYIVGLILTDISYTLVDPRVRLD